MSDRGFDPRQFGCCSRCREEWEADNPDLPFAVLISKGMSICPECGSKRCAKANDHRSVCRVGNPTWFYDPEIGDMRTDTTCGLCDRPAVGMASINSTPYCHASDQGRTCYQEAQTILRRRGQTKGAILLDDFIDELEEDMSTGKYRDEDFEALREAHHQVWEYVREHEDLTDEIRSTIHNLLFERSSPNDEFGYNLEGRHEHLLEASDTAEYRWTRYANAVDNLTQADCLIELSNAMSDLASFLPGFNPETGEVERDEV